jgi:signal transduction histidine kinase
MYTCLSFNLQNYLRMLDDNKEVEEAFLEEQLVKFYQARMNDIVDSFEGIQSVLKIAKAQNSERILARSYNYLGLLYMIQGNHVQSIAYSQLALEYFQRIQSVKDIADAKFNIASSLYKTDNFHDGLKGLLECRQMYQSIGDGSNECRTLKALATIYGYWGDENKAFLIYEECIALATKHGDWAMLSNVYNPLSGLYLKRGDIDKATHLSNESISIKKMIHDNSGLSYSIYGKGKVFFAKKEYDLAEESFLQALVIQQKFGDKLGQGMTLNKLGLTYIAKGDYIQAEHTLKQAVDFANKYNVKVMLYKSYHSLYSLYKILGDESNALQCLEQFVFHKEKNVLTHTSDIIKSYEAATEIYRLEKDTKAQLDYLEVIQKKNTELDSFFYRVSHDLKGPISSLIGLNRLIEKEQFDGEALIYFNMYKKLTMRIDSIVMDLINITRISSNKIIPVQIDFVKLIGECIDSYAYFDNFNRIEFKVDVEKTLVFKSEWVIVNTILQNLIENAIKYLRPECKKPFVSIVVYMKDGFLIINVSDNGQGISEVDQAQIFEMFFRSNEKADGSGLGLYILKRAVERLQGTVTLRSELGEGSSFIIKIKNSL